MKPTTMLPLAALAALLTLTSSRAAAAQTGTITGCVVDSTGAGIPGATIRVEGTMLHATTDEKGRFELQGVPAGVHRLRVLLLGYRAATQSDHGRGSDSGGELHAGASADPGGG